MNRVSGEEGFGLAEAIVAFAIMSLALVVIFKSFGLAARGTMSGEREREALAIARSILAATGITVPLLTGSTSGSAENGLVWTRSVSPYGTPVASGMPRLFRVEVDVALRDDGREGSVIRLSTIKMSSAE